MDETPEVQVAVYVVSVHRIEEMVAKMQKLAKRAERLGVGVIAWEVGPERVDDSLEDEEGHKIQRIVHDVTVVGTTPRIEGWKFLAKMTHTDAGNIVSSFGDEPVPATWRTAPPTCAHCGKTRKRTTSFLLRADDGRIVQIGSSCLKDFLGHGNPADYAQYASILDELAGEGIEASRWRPKEPDLVVPVGVVAAFSFMQVRVDGKYYAADDAGSTAKKVKEHVLTWLRYGSETAPEAHQPPNQDVQQAGEALDWIRSYQGDSEYLLNLQVATKAEFVKRKTLGLVASLPAAWKRHLDDLEREAEEARKPKFGPSTGWVGTLGDHELLKLRYERLVRYEVQSYGWRGGTDTMFMHVMRDGSDRTVVWRTSSSHLPAVRYKKDGTVDHIEIDPEPGDPVELDCVIKNHDFYKGEHQTTVTRCKAVVEKKPKKGAKPELTGEAGLRAKVEKAQKDLDRAMAALEAINRSQAYSAYATATRKVEQAARALATAQKILDRHLFETTDRGEQMIAAEARLREAQRAVDVFLRENEGHWEGLYEYEGGRTIMYPEGRGWTGRNQKKAVEYRDALRARLESAQQLVESVTEGRGWQEQALEPDPRLPNVVTKEQVQEAQNQVAKLASELKGAGYEYSYNHTLSLEDMIQMSSRLLDAEEQVERLSYAYRLHADVDDPVLQPLLEAVVLLHRAEMNSVALWEPNRRSYGEDYNWLPVHADEKGRTLHEGSQVRWRKTTPYEYKQEQDRLGEITRKARERVQLLEAEMGIVSK